MKKDMPLEGLRWSRDSGSALYDTPQTAVLGRAGGWLPQADRCPQGAAAMPGYDILIVYS